MSFDAEFEREILIGAAQNAKFRKNVKRILINANNPWSNEANKEVWEMLAQLGDEDILSPKIIKKRVAKIKDDDLGDSVLELGRELLKKKSGGAPEYSLEELRNWVRKNAITSAMSDVIKDLKLGDLAEAEKKIAKLSRASGRIIDDEYGDWFDGWDHRQARRLEEKENPDLRPRIRTRFKRLDKILNGGLAPEQMGLILGHTNVGKSIMAMNLAFYAAAAKIPTVYISTEMSKEIIDTRIDSRFFARPAQDFVTHKFSKFDLEEFEERREKLRERLSGNLLTVATPMNSLTKSRIESYIDQLADEKGKEVKLIVIDCGDHMIPEVAIREIRLAQIAVYWDLKALISERKLACWATVHASGEKKALLTEFDVAETKDKSKIADIVLTLNQTSKERMDDRLRLLVAKHRNGEKGAILGIKANYAHSLFEEMKEEEEDEEGEE